MSSLKHIGKRKLPSIGQLENLGIQNATEIYEFQNKGQIAYSKSLELHGNKRWFLNGYSMKPNALETGLEKYRKLIMEKGDGRNEIMFGEIKQSLKSNIAKSIGFSRPNDISLGINGTSFIYQVLSNYWGKPLRVLTSDSEFYGTARCLNRLKEIEGNEITQVPHQPFEEFAESLYNQACKKNYDVVVICHSYFKTGNALDNLDELITKLKPKVGKIVIDGSSAYGNISTKFSLGKVLDQIYYIGGIYKFIGSGEGFAYMTLPKDCKDRPVITGWLYGKLFDEGQFFTYPIPYPDNGDRYSSSTLETSIWMRTNEILEYFDSINYTIEMKNMYTRTLQDYLLRRLDEKDISLISRENLLTYLGKWRPLQTCFDLKGKKVSSQKLVDILMKDYEIIPDCRGTVFRICPAVYHTVFDIDYLVEKIKEIDDKL